MRPGTQARQTSAVPAFLLPRHTKRCKALLVFPSASGQLQRSSAAEATNNLSSGASVTLRYRARLLVVHREHLFPRTGAEETAFDRP